MCDVSRHRAPDDCWLTAHGIVYDVSKFIVEHPGGQFSILRHAGTEVSEDFDFHSPGAQKLWERFAIGRLRRCLAGGPMHQLASVYSCTIS